MSSFTHFNEQGRANMVDISEKKETVRTALAHSQIQVTLDVLDKVEQGRVGKGDVLAVAQVAGIMAAKNTAQMIPMCHPLPLSGVNISFQMERNESYGLIKMTAQVKTKGPTGVEMEALTAASVCALTIYDMCKAMDKSMIVGPTYLVSKTGGKNGDFHRT